MFLLDLKIIPATGIYNCINCFYKKDLEADNIQHINISYYGSQWVSSALSTNISLVACNRCWQWTGATSPDSTWPIYPHFSCQHSMWGGASGGESDHLLGRGDLVGRRPSDRQVQGRPHVRERGEPGEADGVRRGWLAEHDWLSPRSEPPPLLYRMLLHEKLSFSRAFYRSESYTSNIAVVVTDYVKYVPLCTHMIWFFSLMENYCSQIFLNG